MQDNQHAYSVSTHADCSSTLHPLCLPCTFQISDWKLMEDTTCMKLVSLLWLEDWVWLDSSESWTCVYGVVVFGRWTVAAEPVSLWVRYFGGDQDQDRRSEITRIMVDQNNELINFCPEWSHHCIWSTSMWASSLIWASETSLARTRERVAKPRGALRSCVLARLPLLAQIGELARRLLIYLDPSDLGPLILIRIISKEPTLNLHDTRDQQT